MREFMDEDPVVEQLPPVCRMLRTKTAFGALVGGHAWQHGDSSTAVYWCLHTMQTAGPDDQFAHPHSCCAGRKCYEAEGE